MNNTRILFMIFNGEIKFINSNSMDHREWFKSLGGLDQNYESLIRGYIMNNNLIFVKGNNLGYDNEVIDIARKCGPLIRQQLNRNDLIICCGVNPGENGDKWEPLMIIKDEDTYTPEQVELMNRRRDNEQENTDIIEFKNNYDDPKFVSYAIKFTFILLIATIISKVILISNQTILLSSKWNVVFVVCQIVSLLLSIISYKKKNNNYKLYGIVACISLFGLLDLPDIIIGVFNLFFIVDWMYIIKFVSFIKKLSKKRPMKK